MLEERKVEMWAEQDCIATYAQVCINYLYIKHK